MASVYRSKSFAKQWLFQQGWKAFDFQKQVWEGIEHGQSGLLHATTGAGKTYAVWLGALEAASKGKWQAPATAYKPWPLTVLWLTPMRALANDTLQALQAPLPALAEHGIHWDLALRTGDTSSSQRAKQNKRLPSGLITTPESLSLLLTRSDCDELFKTLCMVVVDEWHELIGNKRGVQVQMALARLRRINPALQVWGLSATLGNLEHAGEVLTGQYLQGKLLHQGQLIQAALPKKLQIDSLIPDTIERFPWGGHLGIRMLAPVIQELEASHSTLVFCNTRSQAELWYQALLEARPDWAGTIALHHGSLDREVREWVEAGLKQAKLKAVVCTSSLDLGVDFSPVQRVLQIGSPKGIARLLQRAGRSGHAPGQVSRITVVPTHALELVESVAAQDAAKDRRIEQRTSPQKPLDVLVQHLVTMALGPGFSDDELLEELRTCHAYRHLSRAELDWALDFVGRGGQSLSVYPEYRRMALDAHGVFRVPDTQVAKRHRMSIGTIVSDASIQVKYLSGAKIGVVEEGFIARLKKGECFLFAGRLLELIRVYEMTAYVRKASGKRPAVPRWNGGKMPLSSELSLAVLKRMAQAATQHFNGPEMQAVKPILQLQATVSAIPNPAQLVVESLSSREGHHLFFYPFAGRHAHIGLSSLLAWRLSRDKPASFSIAVNDYGFELLSAQKIALEDFSPEALFSAEHLLDHILASLNSAELAQRRFREIARISGLIFQGFPGAPRSNKQLQASSSLFYEVFKKHDQGNRLLGQAESEVLSQELDIDRLTEALADMRAKKLQLISLQRPSPFCFPLLVERLRESLSTEKLSARIERMLAELEKATQTETAPSAKTRQSSKRK